MKQATLDAMKAFAEGKRLIVVENGSPIASPIEHKSVGFGGKIYFSDLCDYQICTTMQVNGREYPCPVTKLEPGMYFWPQVCKNMDESYAGCKQYYSFDPVEVMEPMFSAGLLHTTMEAADAHARALFGYPDRPEPTPEEVTAHDMAAIQKQEAHVGATAAGTALDDDIPF